MTKRPPITGRKGYFFWGYDYFPYLIGGEGVLREDGMAVIPSFGNATFRPTHCFFDMEQGRAAQKLISDVVGQWTAATEMLNEAADARVNAILKGATKP